MKNNQDITKSGNESKGKNMTDNLPSVGNNLLPAANEFQMFQIIAANAAKSGLYGGVGGEEKIFMILLAARELGIPPMSALNGGIWNIKGRIEISPKLMSAMIRRGGHSIKIIRSDEIVCILQGTRKDNGDTVELSFSMEDARRAKLADKDVWKNYPKDMLYNRAMSRLGRLLFADAIGTCYVEGETRDDELQEAEMHEMAKENGYKQIEIKLIDLDAKRAELLKDLQNKEDASRFIDSCILTWPSKTEESILDYFEKNPMDFQVRYSKWLDKDKANVLPEAQKDQEIAAETVAT